MISLLRGFFARPAPPPDDWPRTPDEMRASILARLEEDLPRASAHPDARLHWIADHLFLYVRRLEGFVSPEGAGLPHADVIDSTLYRVIRSGIEAFEVEMDRTAGAGRDRAVPRAVGGDGVPRRPLVAARPSPPRRGPL